MDDDRGRRGRESGPDRYEPLPGLAEMPGFLWRRAGRRGRIAAALIALALVGGTVALAPGIDSAKRERESAEQRETDRLSAARTRELRAMIRPRRLRASARDDRALPRPRRLRARRRALADLRAAIAADARRREPDTIEGVRCDPSDGSPPRQVDDLRRATASLECLAIVARFEASALSEGGQIGNPYRAVIDFPRARLVFCRAYGRPGEGQLSRRIPVTLPRACAG